MNAPEQLTPTLVIIEDDGEFTVRVGDQPNAKSISAAVVPLLAGLGARKLLLITPFDTKVYKFGISGNSNGASPQKAAPAPLPPTPAERVIYDAGAPPSPAEADAELEAYQAAEWEAEKIQAEMALANKADPGLPDPEAPPQPVKRSKAPAEKIGGATSVCGRCDGTCVTVGGGTCPVCRGKGVIGKWGRKR